MRIKRTAADRARRRRAMGGLALIVSATLGAGVMVVGYGLERPVISGIGFLLVLPIIVLGWSVLHAARPPDRVPQARARIREDE
jgi:hypothetical protein